jgi:ABC-type amino acid transport substrate-binding protein
VAGAAVLGVATLAVVHLRQPRFNPSRVWTIGTDNAKPYHYLEIGPDNAAVPRGMSAEVVQEAARRSGIHLAWRLMLRTAPKAALVERKVDLWPLVTIRRPLIPNVHVTAPYLRNSFVSLSTDLRFSERLPRPLVRRVALMGTMAAFYADSMFPGAEILTKSAREDAFSAVCAGEADVVLVEARVAQKVMLERPPGCESKAFYTVGVQLPTTELGIGSTMEAAAVADRLREEIDAMVEDGTMSRLMKSWSLYYSGESEQIYQGERLRASNRLSNALSGFLVGLSILLLFPSSVCGEPGKKRWPRAVPSPSSWRI